MPRYVALFRGINVGKAKRIAMADLRALLEKLGYTEVKTLLNSGNAVFTGDTGKGIEHAARIRAAVAKKLGVDAMVIVKSAQEVAAVIKGNALKEATDASRLLVAVTTDGASLGTLKSLTAKDWGREKLHLGRQAAYIWCADGILESTLLPAAMKALENGATTRNWTTFQKLHELMRETGGS
jgi:uncharacterized protein (DUF1697 family)